MRTLTIAGVMLLALAACSKSEQSPAPATAKAAIAASKALPGAPAAEPGSAPAETTTIAQMGGAVMERAEGEKVSGKVVETQSASGFTYVLLDSGKSKEWYVLGPIGLKKGEKLTLETRMTAEKFESKSLKRTFDKVTFARVVSGGTPLATAPEQDHASMMSGMQMPPGHPQTGGSPHGAMGSGMDMGSHHANPAAGPADTAPIKVSRAEGAEGKTVAEIWASRTLLGDGKVAVRGKVVKSLNGIMGKNWIHLRDGSGTPDSGDHDITITTDQSASVGDVVLVTGVVRVDKDFGAGYQYPVIIEDAKIRKQ